MGKFSIKKLWCESNYKRNLFRANGEYPRKDKLGVGKPSLRLGFRLGWRLQPARWQRSFLGYLAQSWYTVATQEEPAQV